MKDNLKYMENKVRLIFKTIILSLIILISFQANAKLGFVGIGVSDIQKSTKFYQSIRTYSTYDDYCSLSICLVHSSKVTDIYKHLYFIWMTSSNNCSLYSD